MPADATTEKSPSRFWLVVGALVAAEMTCALEGNMILVALSKLFGQYGDPVHVTWLITAFSLTSAASAAICSRLGDIFGRRRVLLIMLGVALLGSTISALTHDLNVIIFGRALQGASMAVLPLAYGILREHATDRQLNVGVGILGGTYSFGVGLGAILGGLIVDNAPWQWMFFLSAGMALLAIVLIWSIVPKSAPRRIAGSLDLIGGGLFVVPLTALLLALTQGKTWGWDNPAIIGLLIGGLLGLAVWLRHELRQTNPLIDVRLLRNRQIAMVNLTLFVSMLGPSLYPQILLPMIQQPVWTGIGLGVTATLAGILKLPTNLTSGTAAIAAGFVARRFGMRGVVVVSTFVVLSAWLMLIVEHQALWFVMVMMVILLAPSLTILYGCAPALIIEASPRDRTSEATGLTQVLRAIGMSIGTQVIALGLASSFVTDASGTRFPAPQAYLTVFWIFAGLSLVMVICSLAIPRRLAPAAEERQATTSEAA